MEVKVEGGGEGGREGEEKDNGGGGAARGRDEMRKYEEKVCLRCLLEKVPESESEKERKKS